MSSEEETTPQKKRTRENEIDEVSENFTEVFYEPKLLADVRLILKQKAKEDVHFVVHKAMLCLPGRSEFFSAILLGDTDCRVVPIAADLNFDEEHLRVFLDHIYDRKLCENIEKLLEISNYFNSSTGTEEVSTAIKNQQNINEPLTVTQRLIICMQHKFHGGAFGNVTETLMKMLMLNWNEQVVMKHGAKTFDEMMCSLSSVDLYKILRARSSTSLFANLAACAVCKALSHENYETGRNMTNGHISCMIRGS